MVSHSLQVKTRASTRLFGGSLLGTIRRSLIGSPHCGQLGILNSFMEEQLGEGEPQPWE
jgi:hypothetical protein